MWRRPGGSLVVASHSEFKQDARDGTFKLMEINGRLSRSNWLTALCGVNIPHIAHQDLVERRSADATAYESCVYWIEVLEDVSNTLAHHRDECLSLAEYARPYLAARKTFADISARDWRPLIRRLRNVLRTACLKVEGHRVNPDGGSIPGSRVSDPFFRRSIEIHVILES